MIISQEIEEVVRFDDESSYRIDQKGDVYEIFGEMAAFLKENGLDQVPSSLTIPLNFVLLSLKSEGSH